MPTFNIILHVDRKSCPHQPSGAPCTQQHRGAPSCPQQHSNDWNPKFCKKCLLHAGWTNYQYVTKTCPKGSDCKSRDAAHFRKNIHPSFCKHGTECYRNSDLHKTVFHCTRNSKKCFHCA